MINSKYQQMRELEKRLQEELSKLDDLKQNEEVAKTQEMIENLKRMVSDSDLPADAMVYALTEVYGVNAIRQATDRVLKPSSERKGEGNGQGKGQAKTRTEKRWTNPHTGESHTGRRIAGPVSDWVKVYGRDVVNTWAEEV